MVDRQTRVKKKRFRKTPGGKTVKVYSRYKRTYAECALTGIKMHGMSNQARSSVRKKSATERRPSAKFGGVLCGKARKIIAEQAALVSMGRKQEVEVPAKERHYVKQALRWSQ